MSLFDGVLNALGGEKGAMADLQELAGHFGNGGLENVVSKFQAGGLGEVVQSWVGTGANLPVSPEQLEQILGSEQVTKVASALGIDTSQLATALPGLINHLTPDGQIPQGGISDILGQLTSNGGLESALGSLFKS